MSSIIERRVGGWSSEASSDRLQIRRRNVAVFIVTYDLNKKGQEYDAVIDKIKSLGAWAHVLKSAFLLDTALSASQVFNAVYSVIDENDRLLIQQLTSSWQGYLNKDFIDWVAKRRLPPP